MATLLYPEEHTTCYNYDNQERPIFETLTIKKGEYLEGSIIHTKLVFLLSGVLEFSFAQHKDCTLQKGEIMLFPSGFHLRVVALKPTTIWVIRFKRQVHLCERFALKSLADGQDPDRPPRELTFLRINDRMHSFIDSMNTYTADGLKCYYFHDIKVTELFFLFRAYYSKEELYHFFYPMISGDSSFADFVMAHCNQVRTVKELARLSHYSLSGFEKKFRRVFNLSPYQWMKQQRAKHIYHEINSEKPLKQISNDFSFSSPSRFNDFCKANFGETPGQIRKKYLQGFKIEKCS